MGTTERVDQADLAGVGLVTVLQALADPVRLEIVRQLSGTGAVPCGRLVLGITKSTASHHLRILRLAGVIAQREEGTRRVTWLRRDELDQRFPGLLEAVLRAAATGGPG
jgi:DNA-binding transcriptional ArsR family regulator